MKNGKSFIRVLLTVVVLLCAMCFVACGQGNAGGNGEGTYYLYENGQLDKSSFIKLDGGKWSDDDNENGTYVVSGTSITIYVEMMGEKEEYAKGTLKNGVLTITIMGKTVVYCQEGKTPSDPDKPSDPSDPSKPSEPSESDKFTISFNANGGTFAGNTSILKSEDVKKGCFVEKPVSPTRNGYVFVGWSIEKESDVLWDFVKNEVNSNVVLYAMWKIDDGHSIVSAEEFEMSDKTLTTYIISTDKNYDLRDKFKVSDGASWRAFTSADCSPVTELTMRAMTIEYGWNDVYVMVENQTTYERSTYHLRVYRIPVSSVTLLDDGTYCIDKGVDFPEVIIPSKYNGKKITSIGESAFMGCSGLTSITIPDSVTSIGGGAFYNCSGLTSVTIPDSVTSIGDETFYGCSGLTSVTIPDRVTSIGNSAFSGCSRLASVTIGSGVTSIGNYAFEFCSGLTSVTIPDSVASIGYGAFYNCSGLTSITIPDSVTSIGDNAFRGCSGLTSITIPDSVTSIGDNAFRGCSGLTSITIPDSVTSIGESAFRGCSELTSITIPDSVTSIGWYAFDGCYKLVEVINKSGLNITKGSSNNGYIAYYALNVKTSGETDIVNKDGYLFYTYDNVNYLLAYVGSNTDLTLPDDYNGYNYQIYKYAFSGCSGLTRVTIPNSVTSIGNRAFYYCSGLTSVTIGNSVTSIGDYAFDGCYKLVEVINKSGLNITKGSWYNGYIARYALNVKEDGISDIENKDGYLFYTDNGTNYLLGYVGSATDLELPANYSGKNYEIYKFAFYGCSGLTSVTIPDSVTSIGGSAFYGCSGLTSVTIPDSVTSIGNRAFYYCSGLTSVTIPDSVTSIGDETFHGCSGLTSVTIPDSVTSIGDETFYGCSGLTSVTIPDSVTSIGDEAFVGCSGLTSVTIGNSVTSIGRMAFYDCSGLKYNEYGNGLYLGNGNNPYIALIKAKSTNITSCTINANCKIVCPSAFRFCSGLTSVTIGNSVTSIGNGAFYDCSGLTSVTIGNSVTSIGEQAFRGCSGLTSVTIGNSVTSIGNGAFYDCSRLTEVIWNAENCTNAGSSDYPAFKGCANLTSIIIGDNVKTIPSSAFYVCSGLKYNEYDNGLYLGNGNNPYIALMKAKSTDITSYIINANCKIVCSSAFEDCSGLTSITIPDSVTSIGSWAFKGCSGLTSVTIGNGVTSIGNGAFYNCSGLTSVTIGNRVTSIGKYAFERCSGLQEIHFNGTIAQWKKILKDSDWAYNVPSSCKVICTDGKTLL